MPLKIRSLRAKLRVEIAFSRRPWRCVEDLNGKNVANNLTTFWVRTLPLNEISEKEGTLFFLSDMGSDPCRHATVFLLVAAFSPRE